MVVITILSILAASAGLGMWLHIWLLYRQERERARIAELRMHEMEQGLATRVRSAEQQAAQLVEAGRRTLADAKRNADLSAVRIAAHEQLAQQQAFDLVAAANAKAKEIAGGAYELRATVDVMERKVEALRNTIEGYGDRYLLPSSPLLDALADEFSYTDAGKKLKEANKRAIQMIEDGEAATCDYSERNRREGAIAFVLDAFNGKVEGIIARVKHDNYGTLAQQLRDAFSLVNLGGEPFRNARILQAYLEINLERLKWAEISHQLRKQSQEEQRRLREAAREEEKARRDFERAQREAAREEEVIRKALAKAQQEAAQASAEERAMVNEKMADLETRLRAAEEKNRRAISMAQQTKRGYVYVISNLGSFGEHVYKIGLTRRLDPMDRIWELSDASVPFDFDVHAIILTEDAPSLEHQMHKHFLEKQVNKVNHRKEFFAVTIGEIRSAFDQLGIAAQWTMAAEAAEYRETKAVERMIADNPAALEAWKNRQLVLEAIDEAVEEANARNEELSPTATPT
jgi:hypothetical protein